MLPHVALIVGASGLIGSYCLKFLLESKSYCKVRALVRRPLEITHPKLEEHIIDFDRLESCRELFKVEDVYCCLGTTMRNAGSREAFRKVDISYPVNVARFASEMKVGQLLVISSMGADPRSLFFYNRVKGEMENGVRKYKFRGLHFLRPSLLLGKRKEFRFAEYLGQKIAPVISPLMRCRLKKYRPIKAEVVAWSMVSLGTSHVRHLVLDSDLIQAWYDGNINGFSMWVVNEYERRISETEF